MWARAVRSDRRRSGTADPYQRFALGCVVVIAGLMVVEYTVTCIWLPRQPFYIGRPDAPPVEGIAGIQPPPDPSEATLSEAVKLAISQHRAAQEARQAAIEQARSREELALEGDGAEASDEVAAESSTAESSLEWFGDGQEGPGAGKPDDDSAGKPDDDLAGDDAGGPTSLSSRVQLLASLVVVQPPRAPAGESLPPRLPLQEEYVYLENCRLPSGAIRMTPQDTRINPYFANQTAMALLTWNQGAVRKYILWYLDHLNERDRFGLEGTIYDYSLASDGERPTGDYDAADSYAATFLSLVSRYVFATGDAALVFDHLDQLERIARVCLALQDKDGLTWAKADHRYKFLMDNCEVARGLADWAETLRTIGLWRLGDAWAETARRVELAIEGELWSQQRQEYAWAKTSLGLRWSRRRWYPDTVGQLYPIVYGQIDPRGDRAQALIARVNGGYPRWTQLRTGDYYPWALAAYAHALAGERERALEFADRVWVELLACGRPWPWYNLEGAYLVLTLLELAEVGASMPVRR